MRFSTKLIDLVTCVAGVVVSNLVWSFMIERLTTHTYALGRPLRTPIFVTACQSIASLIVVQLLNRHRALRHGPNGLYSMLAIVGISMSMGPFMTTTALTFVSYPVTMVIKMCKTPVIMVLGKTLYKTRYSSWQYFVAVLMTLGVIIFFSTELFGDMGSLAWVGLCLVAMHVVLDGVVSSTQDAIVRRSRLTAIELQFVVAQATLFACGILLLSAEVLVQIGVFELSELREILRFIKSAPNALVDVLIVASTSAFGQVFIFRTIAHFGTLTLSTMSVFRKIASVVISIWAFGHHLTYEQCVGLFLAIVATIIDAYWSIRSQNGKQS